MVLLYSATSRGASSSPIVLEPRMTTFSVFPPEQPARTALRRIKPRPVQKIRPLEAKPSVAYSCFHVSSFHSRLRLITSP